MDIFNKNISHEKALDEPRLTPRSSSFSFRVSLSLTSSTYQSSSLLRLRSSDHQHLVRLSITRSEDPPHHAPQFLPVPIPGSANNLSHPVGLRTQRPSRSTLSDCFCFLTPYCRFLPREPHPQPPNTNFNTNKTLHTSLEKENFTQDCLSFHSMTTPP